MRLIPLASERTRGHNVVLGAKHVESSPDLHSCLVWCCPMPQPIPRGNSITSSVTCFTSKGTGLALVQQAAGWRSQFFLGGSALLSASAPSDVQVPSTNFPAKYHTTPNDSVLWYNWQFFHLYIFYISDFLRLYFGCLFYHVSPMSIQVATGDAYSTKPGMSYLCPSTISDIESPMASWCKGWSHKGGLMINHKISQICKNLRKRSQDITSIPAGTLFCFDSWSFNMLGSFISFPRQHFN